MAISCSSPTVPGLKACTSVTRASAAAISRRGSAFDARIGQRRKMPQHSTRLNPSERGLSSSSSTRSSAGARARSQHVADTIRCAGSRPARAGTRGFPASAASAGELAHQPASADRALDAAAELEKAPARQAVHAFELEARHGGDQAQGLAGLVEDMVFGDGVARRRPPRCRDRRARAARRGESGRGSRRWRCAPSPPVSGPPPVRRHRGRAPPPRATPSPLPDRVGRPPT